MRRVVGWVGQGASQASQNRARAEALEAQVTRLEGLLQQSRIEAADLQVGVGSGRTRHEQDVGT
jgi:flagellar hook-length control protein FliK